MPMKNQNTIISATRCAARRLVRRACFAAVSISVVPCTPPALHADEPGKAFATPAEAVKALSNAVNTTNRVEFAALFGSESERLTNPDTVQGAKDLAAFTAA